MISQTKQVELRMLKADEGMVLTNGEAFSSVGGVVYLGNADSQSNWSEISEDEYKKISEEIEKNNQET